VRQLFPALVDDVDPADVYADLPEVDGRPTVRLNMIASVDGASALGGVSGSLGAPADKRVFQAIRSCADAVLVAAGTLRAEHYGPSHVPIAVVTRSCALDWDSPFFAAPIAKPVVITVANAPAENLERAAQSADVVIAGEDDVDVTRAVRILGERGARRVLAEGGPGLNSELATADLLDEVCVTLSPMVVSGTSKRIVVGPDLPAPIAMRLRSLLEDTDDGLLFLRYRATRVS
jgi:riboflavin biosynthesis pyrimidine reductase